MIVGKASDRNNFTILRLGLAWLVVLGHFKLLQGIVFPNVPFIYADVAVDAFFVVSGYLITLSFDSDPKPVRFFIRRIFRLYPLYLAVIAALTLIMANLAAGTPDMLPHLLRYFAVNAAFANFLQYDVNNVTAALPTPGLDPSLWTLKIEVGFYLLLPLLWVAVRRHGGWLLAVVFILSFAWDWGFQALDHYALAKQLPGQLQFFVLGVALYRYEHRLPGRSWWWVAALAPLCVFVTFYQRTPLLYPFAIAAIVFILAKRTRPIGLHLDISYGVYLLHGPVIQLSLLYGVFRNDLVGFLAIAAVVLLLALLAEASIERPFIALGRRLSRSVRKAPVLSPVNG